MVKTQRRKLLAVVVALSIMTSQVAVAEGYTLACIPEDPMTRLENQVKGDKGKVKNKKGSFA